LWEVLSPIHHGLRQGCELRYGAGLSWHCCWRHVHSAATQWSTRLLERGNNSRQYGFIIGSRTSSWILFTPDSLSNVTKIINNTHIHISCNCIINSPKILLFLAIILLHQLYNQKFIKKTCLINFAEYFICSECPDKTQIISPCTQLPDP